MVARLRRGRYLAAWVCVLALVMMLGARCGFAACAGHAGMHADCSPCCGDHGVSATTGDCCAAGAVVPERGVSGGVVDAAAAGVSGLRVVRVDCGVRVSAVWRVGATFSPPVVRAVLRI